MLNEDLIGIVVDEVDLGPDLDALPRRPDHKRGLAALGDREDHIPRRHAQVADLALAELGEVLEALDGLDQREVAPGHYAEGAVLHRVGQSDIFRPRRTLSLPEVSPDRDELDREAAGGATAGEEDLAAGSERRNQ